MTDAHKVIQAIVRDISGRKGLGDVWDDIDPPIRAEIEDAWASILERDACPQEEGHMTRPDIEQFMIDALAAPPDDPPEDADPIERAFAMQTRRLQAACEWVLTLERKTP